MNRIDPSFSTADSHSTKTSPAAGARALRVNDFCRDYGISRTTLYELMRAGKLRTVVIGGRRLIPKDSAEALLKEGS